MLVILVGYRQATVGENPSAEGRLPFDYKLLEKNSAEIVTKFLITNSKFIIPNNAFVNDGIDTIE
jgi:hypothetical protein